MKNTFEKQKQVQKHAAERKADKTLKALSRENRFVDEKNLFLVLTDDEAAAGAKKAFADNRFVDEKTLFLVLTNDEATTAEQTCVVNRFVDEKTLFMVLADDKAAAGAEKHLSLVLTDDGAAAALSSFCAFSLSLSLSLSLYFMSSGLVSVFLYACVHDVWNNTHSCVIRVAYVLVTLTAKSISCVHQEDRVQVWKKWQADLEAPWARLLVIFYFFQFR